MSAIPRPFTIFTARGPGGSSPVGTNGIASTQIAYGDTTANTIKGIANFTFTQATGAITQGVTGTANVVTLTADTNGKYTIAAGGTAQTIVLSPSTTGDVVLSSGALRLNGAAAGTGVLIFPATTTSAGGLTFGTDFNFYRYGANQSAFDSPGNTGLSLRTSGTEKLFFGISTNDGIIVAAANLFLRSGGNTTALTLDTSQGITTAKKIVSYNGVTTAGWGVSTIQADGTVAGTTNSRAAAAATYTVGGADGTFIVCGNINITTSTAFSFSLDCSYTDEANVARVLILPLAQLAGTFVASGLATNVTGAGPYESASMTIRCKASTAITIRVSAGGTYTTVVYNSTANIRQVG